MICASRVVSLKPDLYAIIRLNQIPPRFVNFGLNDEGLKLRIDTAIWQISNRSALDSVSTRFYNKHLNLMCNMYIGQVGPLLHGGRGRGYYLLFIELVIQSLNYKAIEVLTTVAPGRAFKMDKVSSLLPC